jgi:hypothetical protein
MPETSRRDFPGVSLQVPSVGMSALGQEGPFRPGQLNVRFFR